VISRSEKAVAGAQALPTWAGVTRLIFSMR
jgi:hypothetical protein